MKCELGCTCDRHISRPKHGMVGTRVYRIWACMRQRCSDPNKDNYKYYGGRGIKVCERWINSFENFYADMGDCPSDKHELNRVNNNGNYEQSNCEWVTKIQNARNKKNNHVITYRGKTACIAEFAETLGINPFLLYRRIKGRGWDVARAIETPPKKQ